MNLYLHQIVYIIILFCAAALFLLTWPRRVVKTTSRPRIENIHG
jgi:hypothetical protein